jgi:hypothetical protein
MKQFNRLTKFMAIGIALLISGHATASPSPQSQTNRQPTPTSASPAPSAAEMVKVRVVVAPKISTKIPAGSRIVITNFDGVCALEVQDALMRRLVDNADYDVLTRDYLRQILVESEDSWAGKFDTTTATRLGDLLGASLFVVGRIAYCGPSNGPYAKNTGSYSILAVLQILDLRTGKVLISSADEGVYSPSSARLLIAEDHMASSSEDAADALSPPSYDTPAAHGVEPPATSGGKTSAWFKRRMDNLKNLAKEAEDADSTGPEALRFNEYLEDFTELAGDGQGDNEFNPLSRPVNFAAFKAAEDFANGFADKFFARPAWEDVKMWTSEEWVYGESIHMVKLGHCQEAVDQLQSPATTQELNSMSDLDVARYLHNLGVAFLCGNQLEEAVQKLRSAYRLTYDSATLEMLELAARILEWSLTVEVDEQPEIKMLIERSMTAQKN